MDQSVSIYNPQQNNHRVSHCIQDLQNQMCPYSDRLLDPQLSPMLISSQDLLLFEYRKRKMLNLLQKTELFAATQDLQYIHSLNLGVYSSPSNK